MVLQDATCRGHEHSLPIALLLPTSQPGTALTIRPSSAKESRSELMLPKVQVLYLGRWLVILGAHQNGRFGGMKARRLPSHKGEHKVFRSGKIEHDQFSDHRHLLRIMTAFAGHEQFQRPSSPSKSITAHGCLEVFLRLPTNKLLICGAWHSTLNSQIFVGSRFYDSKQP